MDNNCKSCNQVITENFCANCGQKKYHRIDRKYITTEIQYILLHTNKGFLYSIKKLIKNPGKTAKEFIDGDRVNHYKPILLTFILSGISAFISFKIIGLNDMLNSYYAQQKMNTAFMNDFLTVSSSYNAFFMLLLVPIFALATKVAFRKWGHNYYEHVIMNAYILSFYTLINIVIVYPILYFMPSAESNVNSVVSLSFLAVPFILVYFFKSFYPHKSIGAVIIRSLIAVVITAIVSFIVLMALLIGYMVYSLSSGTHTMEYFQQPKNN